MYKTLHKKQGSVTVQLRFARSSVTFCAKRDSNPVIFIPVIIFENCGSTSCGTLRYQMGQKTLFAPTLFYPFTFFIIKHSDDRILCLERKHLHTVNVSVSMYFSPYILYFLSSPQKCYIFSRQNVI